MLDGVTGVFEEEFVGVIVVAWAVGVSVSVGGVLETVIVGPPKVIVGVIVVVVVIVGVGVTVGVPSRHCSATQVAVG